MDWFVLFKLFNRKKREHALIYSCLQNISAFRHDENSEKQTLNSGVGLRLRVPVLPKSVDAYNKQSNLNKSNDHVKSLIVKTWTVETFSGLHFCLTLFATTHFLTFKINCLKTNCSKVYCTFTLMTYIYASWEWQIEKPWSPIRMEISVDKHDRLLINSLWSSVWISLRFVWLRSKLSSS